MSHEISYGHVSGENKGDHARIGADEEEDAANDLDHALDLQERRHRRASRREAEIFLQPMLEEQQGDDDTQNTQDVGPSLFEVCIE